MKKLEEILEAIKLSQNPFWKDRMGLTKGRLEEGMSLSDFDGFPEEQE